MNTINEYHDFFKSQQSDINEHLETLKQYAHNRIVTEFGVRHAVSTFSILSGMPIRLISWDIKYYPEIGTIIELCKKENKQFKFELGDTKLCNIEQTDVLFIDTLHTYEQLITELNRHHTKVNNYIILHDTTSYEFTDEILHGYIPAKNKKTGLWTAVQEFLENNPEWNIKHRFTNNNGLTILEKIV